MEFEKINLYFLNLFKAIYNIEELRILLKQYTRIAEVISLKYVF